MFEATQRSGRILVIDDQPMVVEALLRVLAHIGHEADVAVSVEEARECFGEEPYDVLVSDLDVAGTSGLEFIRELHEQGRLVPFVVLTGYPSLESAVECLRLGAVDYLRKPCSMADLVAAIRRSLDRSRALARIDAARSGLKRWEALLAGVETLLTTAPIADADEVLRLTRPPSVPPSDNTLPPELERRLTRRQREVAMALVRGQSPKQIATGQCVSTHTVRNHLKAIYKEFGVHSQLELITLVRTHQTAASA